jgi:hypothetical protein
MAALPSRNRLDQRQYVGPADRGLAQGIVDGETFDQRIQHPRGLLVEVNQVGNQFAGVSRITGLAELAEVLVVDAIAQLSTVVRSCFFGLGMLGSLR